MNEKPWLNLWRPTFDYYDDNQVDKMINEQKEIQLQLREKYGHPLDNRTYIHRLDIVASKLGILQDQSFRALTEVRKTALIIDYLTAHQITVADLYTF